MKYVAFLDILGFKNKLKQLPQNEAKGFIGDFSSTVYSIFQWQLGKINGFELKTKKAFFHEFLMSCPIDAGKLNKELEKRGILGGLPVEDGILWCATELNTKEQIDELVEAVKEVCA